MPNSVVKIDARTHKIVDVIAVGRVPHEIAVAGDYVFAASKGDRTLTRVDRRTGSVVNSGKYDATSGLAWDGGARLWVGSAGRRRVQVVDAGLPTDDLGLEPSAAFVPVPPYTVSAALRVGAGSLWIATEGALYGSTSVVERWAFTPCAG